jgi:hypothetical protein
MADYGSMPFAEALAYLRAKLALPAERWDDLLGAAHDRAFVVAGVILLAWKIGAWKANTWRAGTWRQQETQPPTSSGSLGSLSRYLRPARRRQTEDDETLILILSA